MSFLSKLFKKNERLIDPVDLFNIRCDVHSHLIPGIDDGAKTMDDSIAMIRAFSELGYKKLITTPHVISDGYPNTPETILGGLEKLRAAVTNEGINMELDAAAEYYVDFDFERKLKEEKLLTFGKNYLLFEVSYVNPPDNLDRVIFELQTQGYKPVLAHPERYPFWLNDFNRYEDFKAKGVLLQLNLNSLTGYYSEQTKKVGQKLIEMNMIDFLGSDCHHFGHIEMIKSRTVFSNDLLKLLESGRLLNYSL